MKYLAVAVISKPHTKLLFEFAKLVRTTGCNILEARWFTPAGEAMGHYLVGGNWNAIAKLETGLPHFERKHGITLIPRRIEKGEESRPDRLPYTIYLTAQDRPGILEEVLGFLTAEEVEVLEINAFTFPARYTQMPMLSLTMPITLSTRVLISDFRERFIVFCDDLNLDATVEPERS